MSIKDYFEEQKICEYELSIKEHNIEKAMTKLKEANKLLKNNIIKNVEIKYRIIYK
ncbi:MAG: hypothetical protein J6C46_01200 [Clostridia bacterium]|nr:hypothetical protein [Clostridia bacterium]